MPAEDYWHQTPRLLQAFMKGFSRRVKEAHKDSIYQAWHTAAFSRTKRMPKLDKILNGKKQTTAAQTNEQMLSVMQSMVDRTRKKDG